MFVRSSAFNQVNGFDASFFAHMEEIDLCWRLQAAGFSVQYCGKSTVYHVGAGTLLKSNPHKTYLNFRNNLFMLYKNLDDAAFRQVYFIRMLLDGLAAVRFLLGSGGGKEMMAVVRAHSHFHQQKKELERNNNPLPNGYSANIYSKSILVDYYLRGKKTFRSIKDSFPR